MSRQQLGRYHCWPHAETGNSAIHSPQLCRTPQQLLKLETEFCISVLGKVNCTHQSSIWKGCVKINCLGPTMDFVIWNERETGETLAVRDAHWALLEVPFPGLHFGQVVFQPGTVRALVPGYCCLTDDWQTVASWAATYWLRVWICSSKTCLQ